MSDLGNFVRVRDNSAAHGTLFSFADTSWGGYYFSSVAVIRTGKWGIEDGEEQGPVCVVCCDIPPSKQNTGSRGIGTSKLSGTAVPSRPVRVRGVRVRVRGVMTRHWG